jgi:HlyD family secretion protein
MENTTQAYQALQAVAGVDPQEIAVAEARLEDAQFQLAQAQDELAGTILTAGMDGTVMAVNAEVGDEVSTDALITVSDLSHPLVQVTVDEADLKNFAVGCAANVTFDSLAGENFPGVVTEISPSLLTVRSVAMVQGLVDLEKEQSASGKRLPLGLQAVVEITCNEGSEVLYVPAQAVYTAQDGSAYVYTLDAQGQPEKHMVVVGVKTVVSAEIQDGLSEGEKIVISQVEEP